MHKTKLTLLIILAMMVFTGCSVNNESTEKIRNVDYTIAGIDEVPDGVKQIVKEQKDEKYHTVFSDGENSYIIIGFGKQNMAGYSIKLNEIYENDTNIVVKTEFDGPQETGEQMATYPYIIIKIEYTEKDVEVLNKS